MAKNVEIQIIKWILEHIIDHEPPSHMINV